MKEKLIGKITHHFDKISVAIVELSGVLKVGDGVHIEGHSTDFEQDISSIQIEHENLEKAKKGNAVGVKVDGQVKEGDEVYLIL